MGEFWPGVVLEGSVLEGADHVASRLLVALEREDGNWRIATEQVEARSGATQRGSMAWHSSPVT